MPKPVFIESRNLTANFPDDATQEEINAAIIELFPRNGQDVAYDLSKFKEAGGKDSEFIANISDEDYIRLNNYRADKKLSTGEFFGIAGEALGTIVGDAFGGLKAAVTEAGDGVLESAARGVGAGTVDLVNLGQKLITPNQRIPAKDEFLQQPRTVYGYAYGPGGPSISQVPATERDYQTLIDQERAMELQSLELAEVAQDLIEGAPVPEVAKGASYIDALTLAGLAKSVAKAGVKSVFKKTAQAPITTTARPIPGVAATIETGESVIPEAVRQNAEAFATKVGEGARKAGFTGVQLGAGAVKKTADLGTAVIDAANKIGLGDNAIRGGIGAAIGYQQGGQEGALQGALAGAIVPKVARGGLRAVSGTADFIGAAAKVGKSGPSRTGIFERMAQAADISPQARNFAEKVLFTQPLVQATGEGLRQAATRSLIGAPVGAALGYAADGQEGAAAGLGAGVGISVLGGALDAGIDSIKTLAGKSTARSQRNAIGDIRSFVNDIPDDVSRTGYAELMDKAIKIAGPERAADMLDSLRIAEGMGATVEIVPPSQRSKAFNAFDYSGGGGGKIIINPDRMSAGSVAHETFHQFFNVGLKTELQQALRDLYLGRKDADGNVIQQGLWDDTEFSKRATQLAERYKDNPEGYAYALKQADILNNPAGFSPEAIDQARMFIIDEMTAEYSEAFMGRSRPGTFNPDRLPLWHRQMLQRMDDIILNRISDKVYGDRNIKDPTAPFTDDNGKPIRVPQLDSVLKRAWSNKMSRERGQTAGKIGKPKEVVIPTKPRDLVVFAQATFGATRDILGSDDQGNPRILTDTERKQQAKADFEEAKAKYQTLSDDDKAKVRVTDRTGQPVDINSPNAQIRITSQTPESVFEQFLQVAKGRGMGNQQISHMRQLFASMAANEGPTFNTVNNPVYKFNKRAGEMRAEPRPPTRQEIYPLLIHVNSVGGFNVQYVDMSRVKANAQKILDNPQYKGIWNGMDDFMNDFKRSLQNLSADNAIPSAELLGNGNAKIGAVKRDLIAESMNVTLPKRLEYANQPVIDPLTLLTSAGKERRVGGSAIRDFRIERLTEVIPTNERMKVVQENAYERLVRRYQPSAFTKETLPNGEAMTNPDGYRILKQTGGKLFRVYDDKGELIGTASTETAAMKKAQSDAAKKVAKEELDSKIRFSPTSQTTPEEFTKRVFAGLNAANQQMGKQTVSGVKKIGETFVKLAQRPDAFIAGKQSTSKDVNGIIKDMGLSQDLSVDELGMTQLPNRTWANVTKIYNSSGEVYIISQEGKTWVDVSQASRKISTGDPYRNPLLRNKQQIGQAAYQIGGFFAKNNGMKLVPDPAGVTAIAQIRQLDNLLANALRTGDTSYISFEGYREPRGWTGGKDYLQDVGVLAAMSAEYATHFFPELNNLTLSKDGTKVILDGKAYTPDSLTKTLLVGNRSPVETGVGEKTLRRAILTKLNSLRVEPVDAAGLLEGGEINLRGDGGTGVDDLGIDRARGQFLETAGTQIMFQPSNSVLIPGQELDPDTLPIYQRTKKGVLVFDGKDPKIAAMEYDLLNPDKLAMFAGAVENTKHANQRDFPYEVSKTGIKLINEAIDNGSLDGLVDKVVSNATSMLDSPEIAAGKGWYSRMRVALKKVFGKDSEVFAQLLGATSAQTPVDQNFLQAVEAHELINSGAYDRHRKEYLTMRSAIADGSLKQLILDRNYVDVVRQQLQEVIAELQTVTTKADIKEVESVIKSLTKLVTKDPSLWTLANMKDLFILGADITPRRTNGKKYNANSKQVLSVIGGDWLDVTTSPKTPNFAGNLTGRTLQATIDVWAARFMRRMIYGDRGEPWRIQAKAETGVGNDDFAFSQIVFERAAKKLGMNPDDLQAILWFGEKDLYAKNDWTSGEGKKKSSFDDMFNMFFPPNEKPRTFEQVREILDERARQEKAQEDALIAEQKAQERARKKAEKEAQKRMKK